MTGWIENPADWSLWQWAWRLLLLAAVAFILHFQRRWELIVEGETVASGKCWSWQVDEKMNEARRVTE